MEGSAVAAVTSVADDDLVDMTAGGARVASDVSVERVFPPVPGAERVVVDGWLATSVLPSSMTGIVPAAGAVAGGLAAAAEGASGVTWSPTSGPAVISAAVQLKSQAAAAMRVGES